MSQPALPRHEWDFDRVPDSELVACCYWEYARESASIRQYAKKWTGKFADVTPALRQLLVVRELRSLVFPDASDRLTGAFPQPWPELNPKIRMHLATGLNFRLEPIFPGCSPYDAQGWIEKTQRDEKAFDAWVDGGAEGEAPKCEATEVVCRWPSGRLVAVLEIGVDGYSVNELSRAFRDWLNTMPEVRQRQVAKRGKKHLSSRVGLERLAILRLLHRHTLAELRRENPTAWKRYNNLNRRWRRDAEKAREFFHRLFPFVPRTEQPLSWPPA